MEVNHKEIIIESKIRKEFHIFGTMSFIFALFYALCFYKAGTGITVPIFAVGNIIFLLIWLKYMGVKKKADWKFYLGSTFLLGISVFLTDNGIVRFFSKTGILILCFCFMIYQLQDEKKWGLLKYIRFSLRTIAKSIGNFYLPIADLFNTKKGKNRKIKNIAIGLIISIPLVIFVLFLLSEADVIFETVFAMESWFQFTDLISVILLVIAIYFIIYSFMVAVEERDQSEIVKEKEKKDAVIAITFTSILLVIYTMFSLIQIFALFLEKMELPKGYSYAKYAREGFFQLLVIAILNMFLVMICLKLFEEHKILKIILTGISICTYIILVSSTFRMAMYVNEYKLTFWRVFAFWFLAMLAILMFGVILQIYNRKFPSFRFSMVVITICYLVFGFMKPDYIVAKYNFNHMIKEAEESEKNIYYFQDMNYIYSLSADAIPAIKEFIQDKNYYCYTEIDQKDLIYELRIVIEAYETEEEKIREFNISRYIAYKDIDYIKQEMKWE